MDRNKKRNTVRDYSVAILTVASFIIPGPFANMVYTAINGILFIGIYAAIFILLACLYRFTRKKVGDDNWSESIIATGVIVPFVLGSFFSMVFITEL